MSNKGFDNDKYIKMQSEQIRKRIDEFGGKLYLEFGGKLFDDHHASRVLPGFLPDSKLQMLLQLKDEAEIVIVINASAIDEGKKRFDLGITYDSEVLRLIDAFRSTGLYVGSVVIAQDDGKPATGAFRERLSALGIRVFTHYPIDGYPTAVEKIVSADGFGKNDYIETTRSLVVVTAPGPGSGKMATCLSQLYHEHKRGIEAGYAKFETFPVWNLPLKHTVNLAYEAATADLNDINMIDPFHLEAYNEATINYNRDIEIFPVLNTVFKRIYGESPYKSPTDMGVNMAGHCIYDNVVVSEAAKQEIIRRYFNALCNKCRGIAQNNELSRLENLMTQCSASVSDRNVVNHAMELAEQTCAPAAALELPDGRMISGKTKELLGASSAMLLNALKAIAGIPDDVHLISASIIEPVQRLKVGFLGNKNPRLHTDEALIALSISAATDKNAALALSCLPKLTGCQAHSSVIVSGVDSALLRKLRIDLTCEPTYETNALYHS